MELLSRKPAKGELWQKVLDFDFDTPRSDFNFSARLAQANYWTRNFTALAILEYKKFMYLAAVSDSMVSPSEIVDQVWHEHLIFTQSYNDFCALLGKQIQHIPSTHNKGEFQRFKQAKEHTKRLYEASFDFQPASVWQYQGMFESLELEKASFKLRTFIIIGLVAFGVLIFPAYLLLRPIYVRIDNPYFLFSYAVVVLIALTILDLVNYNTLTKMFNKFSLQSFVYHLTPAELIYLKTGKLANTVHAVVNEMIRNNELYIDDTKRMAPNKESVGATLEHYLILQLLKDYGNCYYAELVNFLLKKPIFSNTANSMDAFRKYIFKSTKFGKLFYYNFVVLSLLLLPGVVRILTGLARERAIGFIMVAAFALLIIISVFTLHFTDQMFRKVIPDFHRQKLIADNAIRGDWQWSYFLLGSAALSGAFMPLTGYVDRNSASGSSAGSSCGSSDSGGGGSCGSDGGSCGSSCGGCGGGD